MLYDPASWYWRVGADADRLWSSRQADYVDLATAQPWIGAGGVPTVIASEALLFDVIRAAGLPTGALGSVAQQAAAMIVRSAVTLASASTPALDGTYGVTPDVTAAITSLQAGIAAGTFPAAGQTFPFPDAAGVDHQFTGPQFTEFASQMLAHVFALDRCARGKAAALPSGALAIS